ncbi:MAG: hypothetical protein ACI4B3_03990 [Prevotella sp.]
MSITTLITIAGIRHSKKIVGETKEERDEASRRFLEGIPKGERVMLIADPSNPKDANAVAAQVEDGTYGWVGRGCLPIVRPLLKNNKLATKFFCFDNHVTYYVAVESDKPLEPVWENSYSTDNCPLPRGICVNIHESEMNVCAKEDEFVRLRDEIDAAPCSELNDDSQLVKDFLSCAEFLIENFGHSLARETLFAMTAVGNTLRKYAYDGQTQWGKDKLRELLELSDKKNGDLARDSGFAIFQEMWGNALGDEDMINNYEDRVTKCPISKMKVKDRKERAEELMEWIKGITNEYDLYQSFRSGDFKRLATQLNYASLSRTDLYKVITAYALVEKLEEKKKNVSKKDKRSTHKKNLFKGMSEEQKEEMKRKFKEKVDNEKIEYVLDCNKDNPLVIAALQYLNYDCKLKGKYYATEVVPFIMEALNIKEKDLGLLPKSISNVISGIITIIN